jgi:nitrilase
VLIRVKEIFMAAKITVALAQISPVWLDQQATLAKIVAHVNQAAEHGAQLIAFGEALLPGYPYWLELTGGAEFNSQRQKAMYALYQQNAIDLDAGDLKSLQRACADHGIACYLGCIEKPKSRSGHSLYCSMVYIDQAGQIGSVHRKLMPTYEERLVWSIGDGHGLVVHSLEGFTVGGLNCWENWMPLARQSLYAQGENLHVAIWPGSLHNTEDVTRFIAKESRSFVVSVSSVMRCRDIPDSVPLRQAMLDALHLKGMTDDSYLSNGGSCIAGPDGEWIVEPSLCNEGLSLATLDLTQVLEERQNFDPSGHYARPDIFQLDVNRRRQTIVQFKDGKL